MANVYFERVMFKKVQSGTYGRCTGHFTEFNNQTSSCRVCFNSRIENLYRRNMTLTLGETGNWNVCSDWWNGYNKNIMGWIKTPNCYPTKQITNFSDSAPEPP